MTNPLCCIKCNNLLTGKQTRFCSSSCKSRYFQYNSVAKQQERGRNRKIHFIKQLGGCCSHCGYQKNLACLSFHHKDPSQKLYALDARAMSNRKMSALELEVSKCILLCLNCHAELHNPGLFVL